MLHPRRAATREQGLPAAHTAVREGGLHAQQGALVGRVRAVVPPPARGLPAAPHRVRARRARLPAQRRRALLRRRHALLAQPGLLRRRLALLQPAQRLVRAVLPAAAAHGVRHAAVAARLGLAGRVPRGVARVPRAAGPAGPTGPTGPAGPAGAARAAGPAVCARLSRAATR